MPPTGSPLTCAGIGNGLGGQRWRARADSRGIKRPISITNPPKGVSGRQTHPLPVTNVCTTIIHLLVSGVNYAFWMIFRSHTSCVITTHSFDCEHIPLSSALLTPFLLPPVSAASSAPWRALRAPSTGKGKPPHKGNRPAGSVCLATSRTGGRSQTETAQSLLSAWLW